MTPAAGVMLYRLLPDYIRNADEAGDGTVALFVDAAGGAGMQPAIDLLTSVDPDTSISGTCEIANPAAAPRWALPWLGWLVGVDVTGMPDADVRQAIALAPTQHRRGTVSAIRAAVQGTLTGSRTVRVYSNVSGTDPYLITVITLTGETPDEPAALAAAWTQKPAGVDLELQVVAAATWADVAAEFSTWADVGTAFDTWADLADWTP